MFLEHLRDYRHTIEPGKTDPKVRVFLLKLDALIARMKEHPNNTNENIYIFLRDKELRTFLEEEDIDTFLLPQEAEWNKDPFRSSVFHYVNKMEELRKRNVSQ